VPYLSVSAVVIHYEEALYQVYAPLPLPALYTSTHRQTDRQTERDRERETDRQTDSHKFSVFNSVSRDLLLQ